MITAWSAPKDFSPPTAITGIVSFCLFEDLVVLRILGECGKLREPCPHSTWLRVAGRKEISGGLVRLTRIAGTVVPYPVKVDTLPPFHQSFRIRSMEIEVPNPGI